jgi:hypothetical protein
VSALTLAVFDPDRDSARPPLFEVKGRSLALALRAEACLRRNLTEPPTIAALCATLGTSAPAQKAIADISNALAGTPLASKPR